MTDFCARLSHSSTLKKLIDVAKDMVEEGNFDCNEEGFSLNALDKGHIALTLIMLRASAFEVYECETPMTLGVKLGRCAKLLRCAGNDDAVTLKASKENSDHLEMIFESAKDRMSCFEMKLLDIDGEHIGVPERDEKMIDATIRMPSSDFRSMITELSQLGSNITIAVGKQGASFSVEGDECKGSVILRPSSSVDNDKKEGVSITYKKPVELTLSSEYLVKFSKAAVFAPIIEITLSDGLPVSFNFEMEGDTGFMNFFLAPKLTDDDGEEAETGRDREENEEDEDDKPAKKKVKKEHKADAVKKEAKKVESDNEEEDEE